MLTSFQELIGKVQKLENPRTLGVVVAEDEHTIEAAIEAERMGLVNPILIGDKNKILSILEKLAVKMNMKLLM